MQGRHRWDQVIAIREVWTSKTFADWEPSRPLLTAYELHLADGRERFLSLSYRNMLDPYPAIGREMRSLAAGALAATWPKLPLIKGDHPCLCGPSGSGRWRIIAAHIAKRELSLILSLLLG
jgi:hypothetical protein